MLKIEGVDVYYGDVQALWGISFRIQEGELVTLVGSNGAGKSTTLRAISGLIAPSAGAIRFRGSAIGGLAPDRIVELGISQIPEGRLLFPDMTVWENLVMGAYPPARRAHVQEGLAWVYRLFPRLKERERQAVRTMSGGEQQMVAIGRALMTTPKLILLDEPSLGLSPKFVSVIFDKLMEMKRAGFTLMVVEQNAARALAVADRGYVLELGRNRFEGTGPSLLNDPDVKRLYLGG